MIFEWVLILTLTAASPHMTAASVTSVGGFSTVTECQTAGTAWLKQMSKTSVIFNARAMCVSRSSEPVH